MDVRFHAPLARRADLEGVVSAHSTLERVLRWAWGAGTDVTDILVQDEFTHDVTVPYGDVVLVYDTT